MLNVQNADVYTDFNGLAKLKNQAKTESKEALREVAKQFESIFLNTVLKSMREAKLADGALDNDQSEFYRDMYDQQLALHLSGKPGVGLADLIVKQLGKNQPENQKMDTEDFLNRSSGSSKSLPVTAHQEAYRMEDVPGEGVTLKPYHGSTGPLPGAAELSLKNAGTAPIHSTEDFVRQLQPYAERAARELGIEPKVLLAQAALETGWGRSLIKNANGDSSFNLFNIKAGRAWQGKQAQVKTLEFEQGVAKKVSAGFRAYDSFQDSFNDYVNLIKSNPRYGEALKQVGNAEHYMRELQRAGYATDPHYADKIMTIYRGIALSTDQPALMADTANPGQSPA